MEKKVYILMRFFITLLFVAGVMILVNTIQGGGTVDDKFYCQSIPCDKLNDNYPKGDDICSAGI
jgi:hypothetical protein